jgi:3-oxoacyl-[acyl-carrier protein] reductase
MFSLQGKVALVTGASQGIGRAAALALAAAGAKIAAAARNVEKLASLVSEIEARGGGVAGAGAGASDAALAIPMDVADPAQVKAGFQQALAKFGRLDILVNNAGITRDTLALRMKLEDWEAVLRTNLTGAHLCSQQAMGAMLKQRSGRIINVTSVVAETGNAGQANYVAAKAGLIGLTRAIAVEIASRGITVNAVAPGFIASPMTDPLPQNVKDAMMARIPLGRMGTDADVAAAIVFLASDEAGYITGHILDVNGGMYMG